MEKGKIIYLDKDGKTTSKENAVEVRILDTDENGERLEIYGHITPT